MITYQLNADDDLWEGYSETVPQSETLNDPLERFVARRVLEHAEVVEDQAIEAAIRVLPDSEVEYEHR